MFNVLTRYFLFFCFIKLGVYFFGEFENIENRNLWLYNALLSYFMSVISLFVKAKD